MYLNFTKNFVKSFSRKNFVKSIKFHEKFHEITLSVLSLGNRLNHRRMDTPLVTTSTTSKPLTPKKNLQSAYARVRRT